MKHDLVDREKATRDMSELLSESSTPWIVLSGSSNIGKTKFAKKIASMYKDSVFCEPTYLALYTEAFVYAILFSHGRMLEEIVREFAGQDASAQEIFKSMGIKYVSSLKKSQLKTVINLFIRSDISSGLYTFAHYLGEAISPDVKCVFLDDFHRCDLDSYNWILEFWNTLKEPPPTVIAICNFDLIWESSKVRNTFCGFNSPVSVERFDSETAFYEILKEHLIFENEINLEAVAQKLFALYDGQSRLLFETIKLAESKMESTKENENVTQILKIAQQLLVRSFDEFDKVHLLVLRLLAHSPVPITKSCIIDTLELVEPIASNIINKLYSSSFINQTVDKISGKTVYFVTDDFLSEIIVEGCTTKERLFFETKVYRAIQRQQIRASLEQTMDLAIRLNEEQDALGLLVQFVDCPLNVVTSEKKAQYIDKLLNTIDFVPDQLASIDFAQLLYIFGYYQSAEKIANICVLKTDTPKFEDLLLLGDVQHVLLSPKASQTYRQASDIQGISTSDRLKALNREIMALNQEHQEELAKELYVSAFAQYENTWCAGLVELYRNSNNSFYYNEAMEYTLRGFLLARELGEELEMYKCLHNICMLQLQYGHYNQPIADERLGFEPTFEYILDYFSKHPEYRHEQAYPLLDLGTAKMFEYVQSHDSRCLAIAKKYYSSAQLYAKSFYAQHIAETGLLIVNSYQYAKTHTVFVQNSRQGQFNRYLQKKGSVEDFRVHRKILLTLALSAIITEDIQEAADYLILAHPYIVGPETIRYNRLCQRAHCQSYEKEPVSLIGKNEVYYGSDEFVPWLISLCH